jgi:guanylate kinase
VTDCNGARAWKKNLPESVLIWIDVPDASVIAQRLRNRGETEEIVQRRTAIAAQEIAEEKREHLFTYHVMNDDLQKAIETTVQFIISKIS